MYRQNNASKQQQTTTTNKQITNAQFQHSIQHNGHCHHNVPPSQMHNNKYTDHPLHNPKYQTDHFKFQVCHMKYQIYHPKCKIHHSKFQINHLKYQINYPKYHSHAPKKRNTKNCIGQVHSDRRQSRVIDLINLATYLSCHTAAATISNISNIFAITQSHCDANIFLSSVAAYFLWHVGFWFEVSNISIQRTFPISTFPVTVQNLKI